MTTKEHLLAAGCDEALATEHALSLEAIDPAVRAKILDLLKQFGRKALPALLAVLPLIIAGDYAGAIAKLIEMLVNVTP